MYLNIFFIAFIFYGKKLELKCSRTSRITFTSLTDGNHFKDSDFYFVNDIIKI